jgi:ABC-2 type transport system permease protein
MPFTIAGLYLRHVARDRIALFFVVVLPIVVILVLGVTVGGFGTFRVGLLDESSGPLTNGLATNIRDARALRVTTFHSIGALKTAVRRQQVLAGIVIPSDAETRLRSGEPLKIGVVGEQANTNTQAALSAITSTVATHGGLLQAAAFTTKEVGGTFDQNLARAAAVAPRVPAISVNTVAADTRRRFLPDGYSYSAPTMLVLFVFINAIALGAIVIENRRMGLYERYLAGPVGPVAIVFGEVAGAFTIAITQSLLIVGVGGFVFGVHWGNPFAAATLILTWALVGTGAGMLSGSLFRTPEQASAMGPAVGMALGMLGGCMWPLALVGPTMRTVGHLAPQAWAVDAWVEVLSRGGGLADIARQVGVLLAFAAALLTLATMRLRHVLVR